ncbi:unnamed protein product [Clavelina lepadiformis]|uniref:Secreted protein n=1 Tax=Clavelina lepadiformis TaxID=159417 RepID=A0ABP0H5K7_CLALP
MLWVPAIVCCLWSVASVSSKHHLDFKLNCDYECKISVRDLKFVQQESDEGIECHTSTDCQTASSCTNYKPNFAVVPPQAPRNLSLKWYIFQNNERDPEVALNITWTGYCNNNLDGFLIEVSPGQSSITFDTYVLVNNFCHEHNNTFVEINYRCFGLDSGPDRKLIPGKEYFIAVLSLPLPDFDAHQSLEMPFLIEDEAITIPDCSEDDRVEKTSYCRDKGDRCFTFIE